MRNKTIQYLLAFLLIHLVLSAGIFVWMFSGAKDSIAAVSLMMWTPGISAILTSMIYREKLSAYGWRFGNPKYLLAAFLLPLLVSIIGYGIVWISGYAEFTPHNVINYDWVKLLGFETPAPFIIGIVSKMIFASLVAMIFVTGEEIGWSGFLVPKLLTVTNVPITVLITGLYWSFWHYPAIIGGFYGHGTPLWIALPGFTLVLTGASFFRVILVQKAKNLWVGSMLPCKS